MSTLFQYNATKYFLNCCCLRQKSEMQPGNIHFQ